nr:nuclear poly(A) polymerase 4-like isoform X4 [Ipomoea trifida]
MVGSENSAETLPPSMEVAPRNYGVTRPLSLTGPSSKESSYRGHKRLPNFENCSQEAHWFSFGGSGPLLEETRAHSWQVGNDRNRAPSKFLNRASWQNLRVLAVRLVSSLEVGSSIIDTVSAELRWPGNLHKILVIDQRLTRKPPWLRLLLGDTIHLIWFENPQQAISIVTGSIPSIKSESSVFGRNAKVAGDRGGDAYATIGICIRLDMPRNSEDAAAWELREDRETKHGPCNLSQSQTGR